MKIGKVFEMRYLRIEILKNQHFVYIRFLDLIYVYYLEIFIDSVYAHSFEIYFFTGKYKSLKSMSNEVYSDRG